VVNKDYH